MKNGTKSQQDNQSEREPRQLAAGSGFHRSSPKASPTARVPSLVHAQSARKTRRRVIAASFIGNFVEWFDYAVYAYLAMTIAMVFFPNRVPRPALLHTLHRVRDVVHRAARSEGSCGAHRRPRGAAAGHCPGRS